MHKEKRFINGEWRDVTICPTQESFCHFQDWAHATELGRGELIQKAEPTSAYLGGDKSVYETLKRELGPCYKALESGLNGDK